MRLVLHRRTLIVTSRGWARRRITTTSVPDIGGESGTRSRRVRENEKPRTAGASTDTVCLDPGRDPAANQLRDRCYSQAISFVAPWSCARACTSKNAPLPSTSMPPIYPPSVFLNFSIRSFMHPLNAYNFGGWLQGSVTKRSRFQTFYVCVHLVVYISLSYTLPTNYQAPSCSFSFRRFSFFTTRRFDDPRYVVARANQTKNCNESVASCMSDVRHKWNTL